MIHLPVSLRILLLVCAVLVFVFVLRKLKKSQMQVLDSLFLAAIQRQFCNFGRFSTSCNVAFKSIWFHVGF